MIEIRKEEAKDREAIHQLNSVAFDNGPEAMLVDKLRIACEDYLSFVAVEEGSVIGHILFTPASMEDSSAVGMGLAPMAVLPSHQGEGIGTRLVRYGLDYLRDADCPFVIVLGHPDYYPRFGFELASKYQIHSQWEGVPDDAFMIAVFDQAVIPRHGGVARYRDEFDEAM
ncbi:MAG: N-acetyltransferase [Candidatus Thiodiazotropha taylori]|nr:N-acetyltransferase [Candidatus Thiodiazotropha taylori]MCW4317693.1 N-acetyltransferase [Candidatus Thiodiazotropha taylori]